MGGPGPTVLVVDDDASLRLLCRLNLELEGYRVLEAETVGKAQAVLEAESVDVVLLDVHVGRDNGLDLLGQIRRTKPEIRIALFTGSAPAPGDPGGADGMIPKPFTLEQLVSTVRRLAQAA